jgi:hypothetical protein
MLLFAGPKLLPCPATHWNAAGPIALPAPRTFLHTIEAPADLEDEVSYIAAKADALLGLLRLHGVVHMRGFRLPGTHSGLRDLCAALPLRPCADPLASVGVRGLLSAADGVYQAVDSEALAGTFIGLHNDATYRLAAPYAAFACFRRAASGGEFVVADGRAILRALSPAALATLSERKLRVRVAALPAGALRPLPAPLRRAFRAAAQCAIRLALPALALDVHWSADGSELHLCEQPKSAFNRHPRTPFAATFCNNSR